ncbi:STAS domain-containing protein, partial [Kibdelosporangium lantanae]
MRVDDVLRRDERLHIKVAMRPADRAAVLDVRGTVDASTSRSLDHYLVTRVPTGIRHVVVNLDGVSTLAAAGVRVLVAHAQRLAKASRQLHVVASGEHARRVLEVTDLRVHRSLLSVLPMLADGPVKPPGDLLREVLDLRAELRAKPVVARAFGMLQERYHINDFAVVVDLFRASAHEHRLGMPGFARVLLATEPPSDDSLWFPGRRRLPEPLLTFYPRPRSHRA